MDVNYIFKEIEAERHYQATKYADGSIEKLEQVDQTKNDPNDFTAYISHHSSRWMPGGFGPYSREVLQVFRKQMIKTATLAVAAIVWVDKRLGG